MRLPSKSVAPVVAILCCIPSPASARQGDWVPLSRFRLVSVEQGWGTLGIDQSVQGRPLMDGERKVDGYGTHAPGKISFDLGARCGLMRVRFKLDPEVSYTKKGSVDFRIVGDGRTLFDSGVVKATDDPEPREAIVDVHGVRALEFDSGDGGDGFDSDHADWLEPRVTLIPPGPARSAMPVRIIRGRKIALKVSAGGRIEAVKFAGERAFRPIQAFTKLLGESSIGEPKFVKTTGSGIEIERNGAVGARWCRIRESFWPLGDGVRWKVDLQSPGPIWSTPITTTIKFDDPRRERVWTAWNDPVDRHAELTMGDAETPWNDPLIPQPFTQRVLTYGETPVTNWWLGDNWWNGDVVSLPMVSVLDTEGGRGLTLIQSPEDPMPVAQISTGKGGWVSFNRLNRRLGAGKSVSFTMDLAPHAADPKSALAEFVGRYPNFFSPPNPNACEFGGCGAYSGDERSLDSQAVDRLRRMDFKTMWKLSDDYAYMGMFIPPVADADQQWRRTPDSGSPPNYKPATTSVRRLNDFARMLRTNGFHLLSYFNAVEFGLDMGANVLSQGGLSLPGQDVGDSDQKLAHGLWENPRAFLAAEMPNAPIRYDGTYPVDAWQGGWALDPADPGYLRQLLAQIDRDIRWLPDSEGICIDRLDYTCQYNDSADDGVTLHNGKPSRALVSSWLTLMDRLGPKMHKAGKVIFANMLNPRLDLARRLDGVYAEFGNQPTVLNGVSFLCLNKPLIAWTRDQDVLSDAFFQRHLYLGAFPTAPYPTNNHCIQPSPAHDRWYFDYGPLFAALDGRTWVLRAGTVQADGPAKTNLFAVPHGYAVTVTFAGGGKTVKLRLNRLPGLSARSKFEAILPGMREPLPVKARLRNGSAILQVPIQRGCCVLTIQPRESGAEGAVSGYHFSSNSE